jgi:hypothetical protein
MRITTFDSLNTCYNITQQTIDTKDISVLDDLCLGYKSIMDLLPESLDSLFSGHIFPYLESYIEFENCINQLLIGFYKSSLLSLRSCFELGLIHIFYDRNDKSEEDIQRWLNSDENTPFRKQLIRGLKSIDNIQLFSGKTDILERVDFLYNELSNYVHTCGYKYSTKNLNKSNSNQFNKDSFKLVSTYCIEVIQVLVTLFLLKYPIGLHYTPIDDKFGLNPIIGNFLNPDQAFYVKKIVPPKYLNDLEQICFNDKKAITLAKWVNDLPDLTEDDLQKQVDEQDINEIKDFGFSKWSEDHKNIATKKHIKKMMEWAQKNNYINPET